MFNNVWYDLLTPQIMHRSHISVNGILLYIQYPHPPVVGIFANFKNYKTNTEKFGVAVWIILAYLKGLENQSNPRLSFTKINLMCDTKYD